MLKRIDELADAGSNFAFETTLSGLGYARRIDTWRTRGARVTIIFLKLATPEAAVNRVAERVRQGGHAVEEKVIRRRFEAGWRNFQSVYSHLADAWYVYDNDGQVPILIARGP
jgi:predicted ABC-type ATPase